MSLWCTWTVSGNYESLREPNASNYTTLTTEVVGYDDPQTGKEYDNIPPQDSYENIETRFNSRD